MVDTSITADAVQTPASERPLIQTFIALLSRLVAAWQVRRMGVVDRIRHAGIAHID